MNAHAVVERPEITVISVGEVGPRGEPGAPGAASGDASNIIVAQSGENVILPRGTPLSLVAGVVVRASANGPGKLYGLVYDAELPAMGFGSILTGAVLTATTDEWDAITNSSGGLVPNATYFLHTTAGRITSTPNLSAAFLTRVGYALSATKMRLFIDSPVTL